MRIFRISPLKNDDALQSLVTRENGKEIKLIPDCKLRRSSLLAMLERLLMLVKQAKVVLKQLEASFPFNVLEIEK